MDTELKPCPFCGEEAGICEANDICFRRDDDGNKIFGGWRCFCPSCAIEQIGYETREEAVSAWNNRSTEHATHRAPVDEKGGGRMTGIDRLHTLAGAWDEWGLGGTLADVADEIERERACDEDAIENVRLIVGGVIDDMERHVSGVEGMEDSPVARWARELRRALKSDTSDAAEQQKPSCADPAETAGVTSDTQKVTRDPADDVSVSAYDLLPKEDREAIAWVREHGGLERVKAQRRESMPRAAYERKKAGFLGHIAECERALRRRNERISELEERVRVRERANDELNEELNAMRLRLMPEGMEWLVEAWPRFEDGEPVNFGDTALIDGEADMVEAVQLWIHGKPVIYGDGGSQQMERGERVKRPSKVLDADGVEIRVGDEVWVVGDAWPSMKVLEIQPDDDPDVPEHLVWCGEMCGEPLNDTKKWRIANQLTHRAPVIAADGKPLREGETVYLQDGESFTVDFIRSDGNVAVRELSSGMYLRPERLTHAKPEIDTWQRIEEDKDLNPFDYCKKVGHKLWTFDNAEEFKAGDLVRRCKALAGVSE